MAESPFSFYRGAASIMASDLQSTPHSGIRTQISGDAHLLNFGAYASRERRYVFDLNDFDETIGGGAWEWDLKRLTTSVCVAARHLGLPAGEADEAVRACARSYRERMARYGRMRVLDIWYACIDEGLLAAAVRSAKRRRAKAQSALERPSETAAHLFPTLATGGDGQPRIVDKPPLVFHPPNDGAFLAEVRETFGNYHRSLAIELRTMFERFAFADAAYKVVGVGSVGTRCYVALLLAAADDPLFLQLKEARASVYERYVHPSPFADHGERVVAGQRLMQATSDVFLGWARASDGLTYYVRQLRDLKTSADVDHMRSGELNRYGVLCGWALARAHAKAGGEAAKISGYLGRTGVFDEALVAFARDYAGQNERDYEALLAALKSGAVVSR